MIQTRLAFLRRQSPLTQENLATFDVKYSLSQNEVSRFERGKLDGFSDEKISWALNYFARCLEWDKAPERLMDYVDQDGDPVLFCEVENAFDLRDILAMCDCENKKRGTCEDCDFSYLYGETYDRQCRYAPPVYVADDYGETCRFPVVRDDDWCGRWKEREDGRQG